MGVIFSAADDIAELLIPFACASGGTVDAEAIRSTYVDASLGVIGAGEFWIAVGLKPTAEDKSLSQHSLILGVKEFLQGAKDTRIPVWCLSNDIDRWSRKLRTSLGIDGLLSDAVISSEVQCRKPSPAIYVSSREAVTRPQIPSSSMTERRTLKPRSRWASRLSSLAQAQATLSSLVKCLEIPTNHRSHPTAYRWLSVHESGAVSPLR
jgi:hypothetical protein